MNKLIVLIALTGLLAAGCASQTSQGGSEESQADAQYGTGSTGTNTNAINPARSSTIDSATNPNLNPADSSLPSKSQNP
jgi:uncharacterized protein YceK